MRDLDSITSRWRDVLEYASVNRLAGGAIALTVALFCSASWWLDNAIDTKWEPLFPYVDAAELSALEAAFSKSDLPPYRLEQGQLLVPADKRASFLAAARDAECLPANPEAITDAAIKGGSLLEPVETRKARLEFAEEQSAALLLRNMPGVEEAVVRYDQTKEGGIRGKTLIMATAFIRPSEGDLLDAAEVHAIQNILVTLRAGLQIENVLVADSRTGAVYRGATEAAAMSGVQRQRILEQHWLKKIETVLAFVPEAQIAVHVDPAVEVGSPEIRVSVALPRSYLQQLSPMKTDGGQVLTETQVEQRFSQRIQAAVGPLLVGTTTQSGAPVAVNFFDTPERPAVPVKLFTRRQLAWAVLVATSVIAVTYWCRRPNSRVPEAPELKIYDETDAAEAADGASVEVDQLQSKLRAYVEEDPDAAAQSLADFIDRAS